MTTMTIDYAVTNPATGEQLKVYPTITDDELEKAIALAHETHRSWLRSTTVDERANLVRRVGELHGERREQLADIIVREMGKPGAGARRGRLLHRHLRVLRRQRPRPDDGRADQAARRRGLGDHPPQLAGRAARDHAVELPGLPGRPVRRARPDHRQHLPAEARAAVPGVGRGARSRSSSTPASPRARTSTSTRPTSRSPEVIADPRVQGVSRDRLGARRRGGRRDRRPQPEEGRARAGRLRPVHPAQHRRPRRDGRVGRRRPPGQRRPVVQRGQALRRDRRALRAVPREVHGGHDRLEAGRPGGARARRSARCPRASPPTGCRIRSSERSRAAPGWSAAADARATSSRRRC